MTEPTIIADGTVVSLHYTLKDKEGTVIDTSEGRDPMDYLHGAENIVPGLERQLLGKAVGDKLNVVVEPGEGYGERQGPGPQPIPLSAFPAGAENELEAGMRIAVQGPQGQPMPLWIVEVQEAQVLVDPEHPLAGVQLHFSVEITGLRAASEEEIAHGHPHGPGGHHH